MSKTNFFLFLALLLLLLPFSLLFNLPDQKLHLIACNVGQGDAILITQGFNQILIDGGPNNKVLDCLSQNMAFWDREIELVINTHPELDHLAGLVSVLDRYQVKQLLANNLALDSDVFKTFRAKVIAKKIPVFSPKKGDKIKVGSIELDTLWPNEKLGDSSIWTNQFPFTFAAAEPNGSGLGEKVLGKSIETEYQIPVYKGNVNEKSLVFELKCGNFNAILTGDIDSEVEHQIISNTTFKDIEVLKIPHHGSKYSGSDEFLKAINPKIAIISVGKNPWGHPTREVLERLQNLNIKILRTDREEVEIKI